MKFLTIKEAMVELGGVSVDTVRSYLEDGTLTKYVIRKNSIRIDRAEVEELIKPRVEKSIPGGV